MEWMYLTQRRSERISVWLGAAAVVVFMVIVLARVFYD